MKVIGKKRLASLALFGMLSTAPVQAQNLAVSDLPMVGQTWLVACRNLPLHTEASGFSPTRGQLSYKEAVRIGSLVQKYDLPESQQDKHANNDSDSIMTGGGKEYFAWAQVQAGKARGFVPVSCLVNGTVANGPYEDPAKFAERRVNLELPAAAPEAAVSSRGFSKKEKGDKVAMRGMSAGGDLCVKEDYAGLLAYMSQIPMVDDPYKADMEFRREGGLGEFK